MQFSNNFLKFISLISLTAVMGACVVFQTQNAWTAEQKKREVDSCVASANASLKANGKTAEASKVNSYCSCIIDEVEAKYSYEEANREASKIIAEMESSGAINACLESAGLN
jgi:nitrous oxide reductase